MIISYFCKYFIYGKVSFKVYTMMLFPSKLTIYTEIFFKSIEKKAKNSEVLQIISRT